MALYPAMLIATVMGVHGPVAEQITNFPDWESCVRAEVQLDKQTRKQKVVYQNPYGQRYYNSKVVAYCRAR